MNDATDRLETLLRRVLATEPEEIDCDEFLSRVAAYLESREDAGELGPELHAVAKHLEVCPECHDEFEALVQFTSPGQT